MFCWLIEAVPPAVLAAGVPAAPGAIPGATGGVAGKPWLALTCTAFRAAFFGQTNSAPDPSRKDATESGLWVRSAVEKLDPIGREILLLREFEQLSYAEIADLLRLPLNTVSSRLFRARTALRNLLEPPSSSSKKDATQIVQEPAPQPIAQKGERA